MPMNTFKKSISVLLSLLMVVSCFGGLSFTASAATYSWACGDGVTCEYTTSGNVFTVYGSGAMKDFTSASARSWNSYARNVKKIEIRGNITHIGDYAFYGFTAVTGTVNIPNSVTSIGNYSFDSIGSSYGGLTITGMASVQSIGKYAFHKAQMVNTNIVLPDTLISVGDYAFNYINTLNGTLTLGNSIETIGVHAFSQSWFVGDLSIPDSVTTIGDYAFADDRNFTGALTLGNGLTSIGKNAFQYCGFTGDLNIPDNVVSIGDAAFAQCTGFNGNLTFGSSVQTIGRKAFYNCYNFTGTLLLPDSVESVGECAFHGTASKTTDEDAYDSTTGYVFQGKLQDSNPYKFFEHYRGDDTSDKYQFLRMVQNHRVRPTPEQDGSWPCLMYCGDGAIGMDSIVATAMNSEAYVFVSDITTNDDANADNEILITPDSTAQIVVTDVQPDNATDDTITFESSDPDVVTVDQSGNLTPVSAGEATITLTADQGYTMLRSFNVKVGNRAEPATNLVFSENPLFLKVGETKEVTYGPTPEGGAYTIKYCQISALNTAGTMAFFSGLNFRQDNTLTPGTGENPGHGWVAITFNNGETDITSTLDVYVYNETLKSDKMLLIGNTYSVVPSVDSEYPMTYSYSSDNACVTVDSNGLATAVSPGTAHITVTNETTGQVVGSITITAVSITISGDEIIVPEGESVSAGVVVEPEGTALSYSIYNASGSSTTYATVTSSGIISGNVYSGSIDVRLRVSIGSADQTIEFPIRVVGKCGDTAYWKIDGDTLRIFGTGDMWDGFTNFYSSSNGSFTYGQYAMNKPAITKLIVEEGITHIGNAAFSASITNNSQTSGYLDKIYRFTEISLPDSLVSIGDYAFYDCIQLTGVSFGSNLESIGNYAFAGSGYYFNYWDGSSYTQGQECMTLAGALVIPDSVTHIGDGAFRLCPRLTSLTLGNSVEYIGDYAFSGYINADWSQQQSGASSVAMGFANQLVLPDTLTHLGSYAFAYCTRFTGDLVIPDSLTEISDGAFYYTGFANGELTIPSTITDIGHDAFHYAKFVGDLTIPNSVTTIGYKAFMDCRYFDGALTLPNNIATIEESVFSGCSGLTGNLNIPSSVTTIEDSAFRSCYSLSGDLSVPASVTSIGKYAFAYNTGFDGNLILNEGLETIDENAFRDCKNLTGKLSIPSTVTSIGTCAFHGDASYENGSNTYYGDYTDAKPVKFFEDYPQYIRQTVVNDNDPSHIFYRIYCADCGSEVVAKVYTLLVTDFDVYTVDNGMQNAIPYDTHNVFTSVGIEQYDDGDGDTSNDVFYYLTDSEGERITLGSNPFDAGSISIDYLLPALSSNVNTFSTDADDNVVFVETEDFTAITPAFEYDRPYISLKMHISGDSYYTLGYAFYSNGNIIIMNPFGAENGSYFEGTTMAMNTSGYRPVEVDRNGTRDFAVVTTPDGVAYTSLTAVSADPTIASIDEHFTVSGLKKGSTEITFTLTNKDGSIIEKTIPVNVGSNEIYVDTITADDVYMLNGSTVAISAEVLPSDATDKNLTYESSNPAIATVDANGNVTATGLGEATITISSADDGDASTTITVKVVEFDMESDITLAKGASLSNPAKINDGNETSYPAATYTSNNTSILQTSSDGTITGRNVGETTYTVALVDHPEITKTITVHVVNNANNAVIYQVVDGTPKANETSVNTLPGTHVAAGEAVTGLALADDDGNKLVFDSNPLVAGREYKLVVNGEMVLFGTAVNESPLVEYVGQPVEGPIVPFYMQGMEEYGPMMLMLHKGNELIVWYGGEPSADELAMTVSFTETILEPFVLDINESSDFIASVLPVDALYQSVVLSIEDPAIASISDGTVTGLAAGTTNIIATVTNLDGSTVIARAPLEVRSTNVPVTDITVTPNPLALDTGDTAQLVVTVTPDNATDASVTYTSSDPTVATVSDTGLVTAVGEGTATITVTSVSDPSVTETIPVTVTDPFVPVSGLEFDAESMVLPVNTIDQLDVTVSPDDASDPQLTFESSNTDVLTVDNNGNIHTLTPGAAVVTVKANDGSGQQDTITITVYDISVDDKLVITKDTDDASVDASIVPANAIPANFTYTSSDETVLTVDDQGNITPVAPGTATITVSDGLVSKPISVVIVDIDADIPTEVYSDDEPQEVPVDVLPDGYTATSVVITSSDPDVIKVNDEGKLECVGVGTATITVTATIDVDGEPVTVTKSEEVTGIVPATLISNLTGDKLMIEVGATYQLNIGQEPAVNSNTGLTYTNYSECFTVSDTGFVTGLTPGYGTITVTPDCGDSIDIDVVVYQLTYPQDVTLQAGDDMAFAVDVLPNEPALPFESDFTFTVANPEIAKYENGRIYGLTAGTTTITFANNEGVTRTVDITIGDVTASYSKLDLVKDETATLTYAPSSSDITVTNVSVSSSDPTKVRVDGNNVVGVGNGSATVTAVFTYTLNGKELTATKTFEFTSTVLVEDITLNDIDEPVLMKIGETNDISDNVTVTPDNAQNGDVNYASDNEAVATVDENGVITAVSAGTAVITVSSEDAGDAEESFTVIVVDADLSYSKTDIAAGETATLSYTVAPAGYTVVSVAADDETNNIVLIDAATGNVTGLGNGSTNVTVTLVLEYDGNQITFEETFPFTSTVLGTGIAVAAENEVLCVGDEKDIVASIIPANAANPTLNYTSSDTSVVTVDADGNMKAIAPGTAEITISSAADPTITKTVSVTVYEVTVPEKLVIKEGETGTINVTIEPAGAIENNAAFATSDDGIATVAADGTVTAVSADNAVITVTIGGKDYTVPVAVYATDIGYDDDATDAEVGDVIDLTANITNGTVTDIELISNTDPSVASVDDEGNVTVIGSGEATVTVKITYEVDGETFTETVTETFTGTVLVSGIDVTNSEPIFLNVGETETITADITPANADNQGLTYASSDEAVATVDNNGEITAVACGEATITVTAADGSGKTDTVKVIVYSIDANYDKYTLCVGEQANLTIDIEPSDKLSLKSYLGEAVGENESLLSTTEGNLIAIAPGNVTYKLTLTAETADHEETPAFEKTFTFHIHNPGTPVHENDERDDDAGTYTFELNTYCTEDGDLIDTETVVLTKHDAVPATDEHDGNIEYFTDSEDNKYVWDETDEEYKPVDDVTVHNPDEPYIDNSVRDDDNDEYKFDLVTECTNDDTELDRETVILEKHDYVAPTEEHDGNIEYFTDPDDNKYTWDEDNDTYVPFDGDVTIHYPAEPVQENADPDHDNPGFDLVTYCEHHDDVELDREHVDLTYVPERAPDTTADGYDEYYYDAVNDVVYDYDADNGIFVESEIHYHHNPSTPVHENDVRDDDAGTYTFELNTYCTNDGTLLDTEVVVLDIVPAVEATPGHDGNIEYFVDDKGNDDPDDDDIYIWDADEGKYELFTGDVTTHVHNPGDPVHENDVRDDDAGTYTFELNTYCQKDGALVDSETVVLEIVPAVEATPGHDGNIEYFVDDKGNDNPDDDDIYVWDADEEKYELFTGDVTTHVHNPGEPVHENDVRNDDEGIYTFELNRYCIEDGEFVDGETIVLEIVPAVEATPGHDGNIEYFVDDKGNDDPSDDDIYLWDADEEKYVPYDGNVTTHVHNPGEPVHENDVRNDDEGTYTFELNRYCTEDGAFVDGETVILTITPAVEAQPGADGNIEYFTDDKGTADPDDDDIYIWNAEEGKYELFDRDVTTHVHNPGEPVHENDKRDDENGIYTFEMNTYCIDDHTLLDSELITLTITPAVEAVPGTDGNIEYFTDKGDPDDPDDDVIYVWDADEEKYVPYDGDVTTHVHNPGDPVHENDIRNDDEGTYTFELNTYCLDDGELVDSETVVLTIVPEKEAVPGEDGNIEFFVDEETGDKYVWNEDENKYEPFDGDVTTHVHNPGEPVHENDVNDEENGVYTFELNTYCQDDGTLLDSETVILEKHPEKEATVNEDGNVEYYTDEDGNKYVWNEDEGKYEPVDDVTTHINTEKVDEKDATPTADGNDEYFVDDDGNKYVNDPETGLLVPTTDDEIARHYHGDGVYENVTLAPTCVDTGLGDYVVYCPNCHKELERQTDVIIPATGIHTPGVAQKENITPATCVTNGGYDLVVRCTVCGCVISSKHVETDKTPHTWGSDVITSGPYDKWTTGYHTCTFCGAHEDFSYRNPNYQFRCSRCDWWDSVKNQGGILGAIYWMIHSITHMVQSIGHLS